MESTDHSFFGHPRGLATLFFTEMWERFSYYGMRALLILFMVAPLDRGGMGFSVAKAGAIYGMYTAMVYLVALPGGWFADRIIGQRRAVLYGGILISAGEFFLVVPSTAVFYAGLAVLIAGTGLLKPNVSTIVGQIYPKGDPRRDSGFSIFYMGINLGALISPLACGWVGETVSWRLGFGLAGVGMLAGVIQYMWGSKYLGSAGLYPAPPASVEDDRREKRRAALAAWIGLATLAGVAALAATGTINFTAELISDGLGVVLVAVSVAVFAWLIFGGGWSPEERKRAAAILVLFIASVVFWASFEQAGSSLNLFAERNTDRHFPGYPGLYPASWFQSVQPVFVIAMAPLFAWLWIRLGRREPSSPTKFTLGLLFAGLAFLIMVPAALAAGGGTLVSGWWLIVCYLLQTLGELCLSPVGLSAMTKLAPPRIGGLMMGVWFVSLAVGNYAAGAMGSLYEAMPLPQLFGFVAAFGLGAAVVLALLIRPTKRLMGGVN